MRGHFLTILKAFGAKPFGCFASHIPKYWVRPRSCAGLRVGKENQLMSWTMCCAAMLRLPSSAQLYDTPQSASLAGGSVPNWLNWGHTQGCISLYSMLHLVQQVAQFLEFLLPGLIQVIVRANVDL